MQSAPRKKLFSHPYYPRRGSRNRVSRRGHLLNGQALAEAQRLNRPRIKPGVPRMVLICSDLLVMLTAGLAAFSVGQDGLAIDLTVLSTLWAAALIMMMSVRLGQGYDLWRMQLLPVSLAHLLLGVALGLSGVLVIGLVQGSCLIPDDHISPRRSALFMARSVLRDIRDGARAC